MTVEAKAALRRVAQATRDRIATAPAAEAVAGHLLAGGLIPAGAKVSAYLAMGSELDPAPTVAALAARGHAALMPVVTPRGQPLVFRHWRQGDRLIKGPLGTQMPTMPITAAVVTVSTSSAGASSTKAGFSTKKNGMK